MPQPVPAVARRLAAAALAVLLAACGSGEAPEPADTDTTAVPTSAPSDAEAAPSASAWTAGIVDVSRDEVGIGGEGAGSAVLRSVRAARHEGFERVVFEFPEGPAPGYRLEYVDRPVRQCGSGEEVPLAGDAWLEVRFYPAQAHTDAGKPTITVRERAPGLPLLREMKLTCDFEGYVTWTLGLAAPNRYRVFALDGPPRVVVDVEG